MKMLLLMDYFLFALPGIVLTIWAQARIWRAHAEGSKTLATSRLTGAQAAVMVMRAGGVTGVGIDRVDGELGDYYDPRTKVLRLSPGVHDRRSLAAVGVASHEAGHAIQDVSGSARLAVRNFIVPLANLGSQVFWVLILAGILLGMVRLILVGIVLFSCLVVLQLLNLPVEFDASRRGREILRTTGMITVEEDTIVSDVVNASAWTYVAATLTGVIWLFSDLYRFGSGGRHRKD